MRVFCFIGDEILGKNVKSLANESGRQIAVGPGFMDGIIGYSAKITTQFILVFDSATTPPDGAVPDFPIVAYAGSNFAIGAGFYGYEFKNGLYICNSSTQEVKTIGSADCWFNVQLRGSR